MSMDSTTAGQPGAPRCSEAATGSLDVPIELQFANELWDVSALMSSIAARIAELEEDGRDDDVIGCNTADELTRLVRLAQRQIDRLASEGPASALHAGGLQ
jgi:hypothetical protein